MFCFTLKFPKSENFCAIYPKFFFASIGFSFISTPIIFELPFVGFIRPVSILKVVDFPAPFGPNNPKISPCLILKLMLFAAVKEPYFLYKPTASIAMLFGAICSIFFEFSKRKGFFVSIALITKSSNVLSVFIKGW